MAKIIFDSSQILNDPIRTYRKFYAAVTIAAKKGEDINSKDFYAEFKTFAETYDKGKGTKKFHKISRGLIEYLVNVGQANLASIAYSILIKFNQNNPTLVKDLAINGLAIAKRVKDPVHKMARARDLVKFYDKNNRGGNEHIKYLRIANRALIDICQKYSTTVDTRYKRISRSLKPLENYELMLCTTKLDIVQYTYKQDAHNAKYELKKAKELFEKNKNSNNINTLKILSKRISQLEAKLNRG